MKRKDVEWSSGLPKTIGTEGNDKNFILKLNFQIHSLWIITQQCHKECESIWLYERENSSCCS